jgi:PKD repeat protein
MQFYVNTRWVGATSLYLPDGAISENWHNSNLPNGGVSSSPTLSIWGIKGNRQDKSIAPGAVVFGSSVRPQVTQGMVLYGTLPLVSVSLNAPAVSGLSVTINGGTSTAAPGASITSISWDWGDSQTTTSWFPATHSYASPGTYTVTVTSTDSDGNTGSASENVTVQ